MALQVAGLVIAAVGTASSIRSNKKAQVAEKKGRALDARQNDIENQKRIRQAVERGRVERAAVQNAASQSGTGDTSGLAGGLGSARTALAGNVGFAQQSADANARSNAFFGSASDFRSRGRTQSAIAGIPSAFGLDLQSAASDINNKLKAPKSPE